MQFREEGRTFREGRGELMTSGRARPPPQQPTASAAQKTSRSGDVQPSMASLTSAAARYSEGVAGMEDYRSPCKPQAEPPAPTPDLRVSFGNLSEPWCTA